MWACVSLQVGDMPAKFTCKPAVAWAVGETASEARPFLREARRREKVQTEVKNDVDYQATSATSNLHC